MSIFRNILRRIQRREVNSRGGITVFELPPVHSHGITIWGPRTGKTQS